MKDKKTDEMLKDLKTAKSLDGYLENNSEHMLEGAISERLNALIVQKGLVKSAVLKRAEINDIYGYQLFAGSRKPSRDKLIALCIGMCLSLDETQQILKFAGFAPLYAKNKRDSILIFGIEQQQSVLQINNLLYDHNEKTL